MRAFRPPGVPPPRRAQIYKEKVSSRTSCCGSHGLNRLATLGKERKEPSLSRFGLQGAHPPPPPPTDPTSPGFIRLSTISGRAEIFMYSACFFVFFSFFQPDSNSPVWQQLNYSSAYSYAKNGESSLTLSPPPPPLDPHPSIIPANNNNNLPAESLSDKPAGASSLQCLSSIVDRLSMPQFGRRASRAVPSPTNLAETQPCTPGSPVYHVL